MPPRQKSRFGESVDHYLVEQRAREDLQQTIANLEGQVAAYRQALKLAVQQAYAHRYGEEEGI